ncbi:MAG: DUF2786 domain-containing protein [Ilumatobacteraceae bacterium]
MTESRHGRSDPADESLLARVRKLMDKAEATSNPHEADAFSRKAAELIALHRIDPNRLATFGAGDELAIRNLTLGRGAYVRARLALLMAVASSHDARVVFGPGPEGMVAYVAGFTSDLDAVELIYHSLHGQAAAQMAEIKRSTPAATQRFRRAFLFGYADRMGELLAATRASVESSGASSAATAELGLALRDRSERIDEFAERSFGRTRTARMPGAALESGWRAGTAAADRADVGRVRLAGRRALGRG